MNKVCTRCKIEKDILEFHNGRPRCKLCRKQEAKIYYSINKDKILVYSTQYQKDNRLKTSARVKLWRANNYSKEDYKKQVNSWRNSNRDKYNQYMREYRKTWAYKNTDEYKLKKRVARHNRRVINSDLSYKSAKYILESFKYTCVYCNKEGKTIDHFTPVFKGGNNDLNNLVVACGSCNSSKRDLMPLNFIWRQINTMKITNLGGALSLA